jgi:hypothetical protein
MAITEMRPIANKTEKSDNPEFQSRPSGFLEDIRNSRAATQTISTKIRGCLEFGRQSRSDRAEEQDSADDEVKHGTEKGPEEVVVKQNRAQGAETEIRAEAVASSHLQPNQTVWFGKLDHLVSSGSVQKRALKTIAPRIARSPRWCPLGLTPS